MGLIMRRAKYSMKRIICPNASSIGYSTTICKPGYWVVWVEDGREYSGRVLGRIEETENKNGLKDCAGMITVIRFYSGGRSCGVAWVDRHSVRECYPNPAANLAKWITGDDWVKSKKDILRIIAMQQHGTLSEEYIGDRDNPEKPYNCRPEYVNQFELF